MSYSITIAFDQHSRDARGTPVPVEVFNERLEQVIDEVAYLSDVSTVSVEAAGLYHVRAELPTGENVATTVRVQVDGPVPVARLVAAEGSPREDLAWAYAQQSVSKTSGVRIGSFFGVREFYDFSLSPGFYRFDEPIVTITGLFWIDPEATHPAQEVWHLAHAPLGLQEDSEQDRAIAAADPRLLKRIGLRPHFSGSCPVYVRRGVRLNPEATEESGFIVVPVGTVRGSTEVLFVRSDFDGEPSVKVSALVHGVHPEAEALLAYLGQGAFRSAKRIGAQVTEQAVKLLRGKREDPFAACIAGYFLLLAGQLDRLDWMGNLARWFPAIPDGAVIFGSALLRNGERQTARSFLLQAVERGIPVYTAGLRLLFDNLRVLAEEDSSDEQLMQALKRIRNVAAYADWHAQTTTVCFPPGSEHFPFILPS